MIETLRQRRLRTDPKVTLAELASASGIPLTTIHEIESGGVLNPGYRTVTAILAALDRIESERRGLAAVCEPKRGRARRGGRGHGRA